MQTIPVKTPMNNNMPLSILPADTGKALRVLIKISEQMFDLAERETQALVQNDMTAFSILQDEKESVLSRYEQASSEFRARLEDFRGADRALLDRLEELQARLGDKTRSNTAVVSNMNKRSKDKVQNALLTVQELAEEKPVRLAQTPANEDAEKRS